ncbi:MAG TPA: cobalamin biosynthesis protein [Paracoccaceae bacterium]|nr:cobalamin biosynthesis protein [Paracoccaceae bacterium]
MIVAGFGFRKGADAAALAGALAAARADGRPAPGALATAEDKAAAPAFATLARDLGLPALAVPLPALAATDAASSALAPARYDSRSLAEAAALAAAGPGARLLGPRAVSPCRRATCALAEGPDP